MRGIADVRSRLQLWKEHCLGPTALRNGADGHQSSSGGSVGVSALYHGKACVSFSLLLPVFFAMLQPTE